MGLFSFLTGSGKAAEEEASAAEPADRGAKAPEAAADKAAEPGGSSEHTSAGGPTGPGWNFGALAEPLPASNPEAVAAIGPGDPAKTLELKPHIIEAISSVFDPEIPVNIYELGLIYDIIVDAEAKVLIRMTLTSPACPSAQSLPGEVQWKVKAVPGVADAVVDIVWDPPWTQDKMSDVARLQLGLF